MTAVRSKILTYLNKKCSKFEYYGTSVALKWESDEQDNYFTTTWLTDWGRSHICKKICEQLSITHDPADVMTVIGSTSEHKPEVKFSFTQAQLLESTRIQSHVNSIIPSSQEIQKKLSCVARLFACCKSNSKPAGESKKQQERDPSGRYIAL